MVVANITFPLINSMKKFVLKVKQEECLSIMTWQPRSPSPKMRSPSVTTITWILLSGQFFKTSRIFPLYGYYVKSKFMHYRCRTAKKKDSDHTSLSDLCIDPEDAWRYFHISGKLHQQLECKLLEEVPQHYQSVAYRTVFHFSPVNPKHKNDDKLLLFQILSSTS